ncbi:MAG: hypothetical protein FJX76_26940, partial [Armatimonadetes bacterium]|nr:hypothetical protein [Armatimonadota bacterium]
MGTGILLSPVQVSPFLMAREGKGGWEKGRSIEVCTTSPFFFIFMATVLPVGSWPSSNGTDWPSRLRPTDSMVTSTPMVPSGLTSVAFWDITISMVEVPLAVWVPSCNVCSDCTVVLYCKTSPGFILYSRLMASPTTIPVYLLQRSNAETFRVAALEGGGPPMRDCAFLRVHGNSSLFAPRGDAGNGGCGTTFPGRDGARSRRRTIRIPANFREVPESLSDAAPRASGAPSSSWYLGERMLGPRFIGRYKVIEEIGRGGMGIVYRGEDPRLERTVAIKVLPPRKTSSQKALERFKREARVCARLDHPYILKVYDYGEEEQTYHLVMELVE